MAAHRTTQHTISTEHADWIRNYGAPAINICRCILDRNVAPSPLLCTLLFFRSGLLRCRCSLAGGAESTPLGVQDLIQLRWVRTAQHSMTASTIPSKVIRGTNYCTVHTDRLPLTRWGVCCMLICAPLLICCCCSMLCFGGDCLVVFGGFGVVLVVFVALTQLTAPL